MTGLAVSDFARSRPKILLVGRKGVGLASLAVLLREPPIKATVATATASAEALTAMSRRTFDVVVIASPEATSGEELMKEIRTRWSNVPVILLIDPGTDALRLVDSGADGVFTNAATPEEFLVGLASVLAGNLAVGPRRHVQLRADETRGSSRGELTRVEREILVALASAHTVSQIAARRRISERTVRNHLTSIYRKLDVTNRTEAALRAAKVLMPMGTAV